MTLRRIPTQRRSRQRFEAILDAAATLFSDQGFDATTMEAIAEAAQTSIGSLYQFFPNKLTLFRALAQRCLARSGQVFEGVVKGAQAGRPWRDLVDEMVDGFTSISAADPAFRALWMNQQLYGEYAEADEALLRSFIERSADVVGVYAPDMPLKDRKLTATMIVSIVTGATLMLRGAKPSVARRVMEETKVVLHRYLEPIIPAERASPAERRERGADERGTRPS